MLTRCAHDYVHADSIRSSAVHNQEQKKKKKKKKNNNDQTHPIKKQTTGKQTNFIMLHVHEFSNRENKFVTV